MFLGKTEFSSYVSLVYVYIYTSKFICLTIRLWISLSTDISLTWYKLMTGGGVNLKIYHKSEKLGHLPFDALLHRKT